MTSPPYTSFCHKETTSNQMCTYPSVCKPSRHIVAIGVAIPTDSAPPNDTVESLMSFGSLVDYWAIPQHVSYNMTEVMDFWLLCDEIWIDLIE